MKRLAPALLTLVFIATSSCLAQSGSNDNVAQQLKVRVVSLTLLDFSTDKLVIGVGLAANSPQNVTVDELMLSGLQLNGVPVYAAPIKHRFKLHSGSSVKLPEQLALTIYLRDLSSLKPVRDAISNGYATLNGNAVIRVPLNPVARLILLSSHADVSKGLHQQVAFNIPGGTFVSASLLRVLDLADAAIKKLDSTIAGATKLGGR